jgi:hypothetical protein
MQTYDSGGSLQGVPPPQSVRDELGRYLRRIRLLRRLLRVSEAVQKELAAYSSANPHRPAGQGGRRDD